MCVNEHKTRVLYFLACMTPRTREDRKKMYEKRYQELFEGTSKEVFESLLCCGDPKSRSAKQKLLAIQNVIEEERKRELISYDA